MEGTVSVPHLSVFPFVVGCSKGEVRPGFGGIVVVVGGVAAAVVGVLKRKGGGQASHLPIYKSQCEGWGRNGFGGRPPFQTDSPFQIFVGSFDGGTAPVCLARGRFSGTAPHYFQHNLTHSHRDGTVRTLGRSQAVGPPGSLVLWLLPPQPGFPFHFWLGGVSPMGVTRLEVKESGVGRQREAGRCLATGSPRRRAPICSACQFPWCKYSC